MNIISSGLLEQYNKKQKYSLAKHLKGVDSIGKNSVTFAFTRSSVFSSLIEGSGIDLDSYLFNKDTKYQSREMNQIDDLIEAYQFAKTRALTPANIIKAHSILSRHFDMQEKYKGGLRDKDVRIGNFLTTVYVATPVQDLKLELDKFFADLSALLKRKKHSYNEAFYHAAMAHLVFVKIHPFADGNGRVSRLLEKWFLSKTLGQAAWKIPSEINYWLKRDTYYKNLKAIGGKYAEVDYSHALPFLLMLPTSFGISKKYLR